MTSISLESPTVRSRRHSAVRCAAIALFGLALAVEPAPSQPPAAESSEAVLDLQSNPRKHRKRQKRPVKMGTSGGNVNDITDQFCCAGTLGGLVRKGGDLFILSNNHVLALSNLGQAGDAISQPGLIDARCNAPDKNTIAELSGFKKIKFGRGRNLVDAAIAAVVDDSVDASGAIIGIGVPGNEPVPPKPGMQVTKAGRTTGVRVGVVDSINSVVSVQYTEECSEDAAIFTARFVKQFIVTSTTNQPFSGSGDSGALILEDASSCPRQVGLLFAGNEQVTVGSKMGSVLKQLRKMNPKGPAELVGCDPPAAAAKLEARAALPELGRRALRLAERVQTRAESAIFAIQGVQAMGIGRSSSQPGAPVFKVYVDGDRAAAVARIPRQIEGIPVEVVESGPIFASSCPQAVD